MHHEPLLGVLEFVVCVLVLVEVPSMPAMLFSKTWGICLNKAIYPDTHTYTDPWLKNLEYSLQSGRDKSFYKCSKRALQYNYIPLSNISYHCNEHKGKGGFMCTGNSWEKCGFNFSQFIGSYGQDSFPSVWINQVITTSFQILTCSAFTTFPSHFILVAVETSLLNNLRINQEFICKEYKM